MVIIVDYGMGNLGSIQNMLRRFSVDARISSDPDVIAAADRLVLPGVGAFDHAMANLESRRLLGPLNDRVISAGVPVLGICLGMQLLTLGSEEGSAVGLGWIEARTVRFRPSSATPPLKVPHMRWNQVHVDKDSALFSLSDEQDRFYFVHSFHVQCDRPEDVAATTRHGIEFVSAVVKDNIMGVQFHPEKSHRYGMKLLRRFVEFQPSVGRR